MVTGRAKTSWITTIIIQVLASTAGLASASEREQARQILDDTGIKGGLIVHLGCDDGKLTAALRANDSYIVHGLDENATNIRKAREHILSLGLYGKVSVDKLESGRLAYIDNLVNLVISEDPGAIPKAEVMRILAPNGVAYINKSGTWIKTVKPWPDEIDEWTHYLHDSTGNAVGHDSVGPPRRLQWIGSPKWSRHHDTMGSLCALVSAGGRIFYIIDEGSKASVQLPPKWVLVARDAFSGVVLWKHSIENWHPHLWPFKSGPTQLARRLVAVGDTVYVTLGLDAPLSALDAATGELKQMYKGSNGTEEVIASDGVLFLIVNATPELFDDFYPANDDCRDERDRVAIQWPWDGKRRAVTAIQANSGRVLWQKGHSVVPLSLAANSQRVVFYDGERVVSLDRKSGELLWRSDAIEKAAPIPTGFAPTLVLQQNVVLLTTGLQELMALSANSGETLWGGKHAAMGHHCSEDVLVIDGLVWTGATAGGRDSGIYTGRELLTGEIKREFPPDVKTFWFHQRCYRSKATDNFILPSRTGIEFVDLENEHWIPQHWVRGGCAYGIMPSNGMIYTPPHSCACYMESLLHGLCALAPESGSMNGLREKASANRLERGPAYGVTLSSSGSSPAEDWPTYRHDTVRSGSTTASLPADLKRSWEKKLGGRLTSIVVADHRLFVASVDSHTVYAMNANSGDVLWHYIAGGRVDSPPTIYEGRVLFGSADGWVYCVRAADGALIWRFRAAPADLRHMAFEQLESVWPVHGSVLVQDDVVYCVAGRAMFVDGGMRLLRLDPKSGRMLTETILDDRDPESSENLQVKIRGMNMPVALPDVLSSDGKNLFMRSQRFDLEGQRMEASTDAKHLFSPTGYLDGSQFHRAYWLFGTSYVSGAGGYYRAGRAAPAGRLLVFDDSKIYGYGRKPEYFRWTAPMEYRLFASSREPETVGLNAAVTSEQGRPGAAQQPGGGARGGQPVGGARGGQRAGGTGTTAQSAKLPYAGATPGVVRGFKPPFQRLPTTMFACDWSEEIPLHALAMVLAGKMLFVAGPPDLIDEEETMKRGRNPMIQAKLAEQAAAWDGQRGASLWAISTDGKELAKYSLQSLPVWDGIAVANGQLYIATQDGTVTCMEPK